MPHFPQLLLALACCVTAALPSPAHSPAPFTAGHTAAPSPSPQPTPQADRAALLAGVESLGPPPGALPGEVLALGERAFVVAAGGQDDEARAVVAAVRAGRGGAVAFSHDAFFNATDDAARRALLTNALVWSANAKRLEALDVAVLGGEGFPFSGAVKSVLPPAAWASADVVLWRGGDVPAAQAEELVAFVERGGGLVFGVCPWGRQQLYGNTDRSIRTDLPHNQVGGALGLVFGFDTVADKAYSLAADTTDALHAGRALDAATRILEGRRPKHDDPSPGRAARLTGALLRALPPGDPRVAPRLTKALGRTDLAELAPTPTRPVDLTTEAGARIRLAVQLATTTWLEAAPKDVPAAPGSADFPGAIPERAPRITRAFSFEGANLAPGSWHSTGLYAAPGEVIAVQTQDARGWRVRIGAHADTLWHKPRWSRWPELTREDRLPEQGTLEVASAFGGPIYLVPQGGADPAARITLQGAVEAPLLVHGDPTSLAAWPERRTAPAPWAELVADGVIFTVPAGAIRDLDDPAALTAFWSRAMACYPELLGEALHPTGRPERLVEDIQISAGYMHSGYPVMTHGAERMDHSDAVDLATLETHGNWGYFHEFGHNAQDPRWTFEGTGEVTNNLFSLYLGERMAGITPWENPWLENQKASLAPFLAAGSPYATWKQQPGLALLLFALVQRDFGWQPFQDVLASYGPDVRPADDLAERDEWLVRLSHATGHDLGPYFERWGVPTSEAARAEVAELPPWMPSELRR